MKHYLALFLSCLTLLAKAQMNESFYVFDAKQKPTDLKHGKYLLRVQQLGDSSWQRDYYRFFGPLMTRENFKDKDGRIYHGTSYHYAANGRLDSTAEFVNGKKHGDAYRLSTDSFSYRIKYVFDNDVLVETVDMTKKGSSNTRNYDDEKESEYPGGLSSWTRYLNKNLRYPARAMDAKAQGQAIVGFVVDSIGGVSDLFMARSVELSIDDEACRIISASGNWEPAFQNGKTVKSNKLQTIEFRIFRQ